MTLHDELQRIADRAPVADVPDDTWSRARDAHRRNVALLVAGIAAVLALVAGAVAWVPGHVDPPVADTDSLGVPDHLYAVPERMEARDNDGGWMRDEVTDDPTVVGIGAAAWVTNGGLPVVVGASDGAYHLLDLPDFVGNNWSSAVGLGAPTIALAPDGRHLAYSYAVFGPDAATAPIPTGIRVVDLTTGARREIPVPGKEGTAIRQIEWSPDGSWLAFTGTPQDTWTEMSMGSRGPAVLGRIPPGRERAQVRDIGNDQAPMSVDDRGTVQWQNGKIHVWGPGSPDPDDLESVGHLSDGRPVVFVEDTVDFLGVWSEDGLRSLTTLDPGVGSDVTVATDLMPPEHPTVERPEPSWPWSEERLSITIGLGVAAVIAACLGLRWVVRRYRSAR
ncbi:hypothetical protein [Nocardioides conyzicola]|uniref:WD40 repeat domain-containing protein n=1 Tax=Nocardioides conyzicola TaxID=1651781 RepID=A0ABP8X7I0_9ACTN